jgi:glycosyltransferase involved in cell wall biosynthesis
MSDLGLPLVSIGMPVWNGESFLYQAIESLLSQDYANIELIILDNLSTDKTAEICRNFAIKDNRVQYLLDSQHRDVSNAFHKIASLVKGDYFMVGNDDDVYEATYITTLMKILLGNPDIGLAYSGCNSILTDGTIRPSIWKWRLTKDSSTLNNFVQYFFKRNPIPICFGIMKTNLHREGLNFFYRPDSWGWNHDNLYMLRILSIMKVHSIPDPLFFYRERNRNLVYAERGQRDIENNIVTKFWKTFVHQINVSSVALRIVYISSFDPLKKIFLLVYIFIVTFYFSIGYIFLIPLVKSLKYFFSAFSKKFGNKSKEVYST